MAAFEKSYQDALDSGLLPGVSMMASNKEGTFKYSNKFGVKSLKTKEHMQLDSVLAIASCTKLMTAIAALQCVEKGLLDLDADIAPIVPEAGKFGIITAFDEKKEAVLVPKTVPITLRQLLTHTSGQAYDIITPVLQKWRESRGEEPWTGETMSQKTCMPLLFQPGTSWLYGTSMDWVGQLIERVNGGETLDAYMRKSIWDPLGMKNISFFPKEHPEMMEKLADLSALGPDGKAIDFSHFDITYGAKECIGGGGIYTSVEEYMKLLQAVIREDTALLKPESYVELFKPQLDETCKKALNDLLLNDEGYRVIFNCMAPPEARKNWCFAGLLIEDEQLGWFKKNTIVWGGLPCLIWFMDREAGLYGFAGSQVLPPMAPPILQLHGHFERGIYEMYDASKTK